MRYESKPAKSAEICLWVQAEKPEKIARSRRTCRAFSASEKEKNHRAPLALKALLSALSFLVLAFLGSSESGIFTVLSDAAFLVSVAALSFFGISFAVGAGALDVFLYPVYRMRLAISKGGRPCGYSDYCLARRGARRGGRIPVVGIFYFALAILFAVLSG